MRQTAQFPDDVSVKMLQNTVAVLEQRVASLTEERDRLGNDLADALDLKDGRGPTALSMVAADRDRLTEENARLREALEWEAGINKALLPYQDRAVRAEALLRARDEEIKRLKDCEPEAADEACGECVRCRREMWEHELSKRQMAEVQLTHLREAAALKRNTRIQDAHGLSGTWIAVPLEDFDALRAALSGGAQEPAAQDGESK